jgi:hypothetical protein
MSVVGNVNPLIEKAAPVRLACEMVTVEPPVLVKVSDRDLLLLTCTLPKARLVGFAESVPAARPVPESGMLRVGFEPLEVILTLPLTAPPVVGANCTVNDVLWPAFSVTGRERPLRLNPLPVALAAEIVTLDPPELVNVSDKLVLLPTCTLPKGRLVGFAVSVPWVTPVPVRGTLKVGFEPLEVMLTLPLAAPLVVGENFTVNEVLWPAFSVMGRERPLRLNPLPVALAAEIVMLDPPELVNVSDKLALLPTCTLPKGRLAGFAVSAPWVTPVPVRGTLRFGFEPLEVMPTLPLAAPLVVGENCTVNDVLWPAFKVNGSDSPVKLNPLPLALAADIVTLDPPELVNVSDKLVLLPTCTFPNARLVGFAVSAPCVKPVPVRGTLKVGFEPLEVTLTLPLAAPLVVGENCTVNEVLWPAFKVNGSDSPVILNPLPLALAADIVTLDPPELVKVSDKLVLLPTCMLPNARLVGFAVNAPAAKPVPESGMLEVGFEALEVMLTLPLAAPLVVGANCTVNEVLWPAFKVKGSDSPVILNPLPLALAAEIVTLDPPELVNVSDKLVLLPTCTLPNARLVGFAVSVPWVSPVPVRGTLRVGFDPLEVMLTLPLAAPLVVGENCTVNDVLWPAFSVNGSDRPLKLNPGSLALAAEIVRLVPPELVRVPASDFDVPTWMLPKLKLAGFDPS